MPLPPRHVSIPIPGDGNCLFRCLARAWHGDQEKHAEVRAQIVAHMREHPDEFRSHVNEPWDEYLARMARDGEWGDEIEIRAAELLRKGNVTVFHETAEENDRLRPDAAVLLRFVGGEHYELVVPVSEAGEFAKDRALFASWLKKKRTTATEEPPTATEEPASTASASEEEPASTASASEQPAPGAASEGKSRIAALEKRVACLERQLRVVLEGGAPENNKKRSRASAEDDDNNGNKRPKKTVACRRRNCTSIVHVSEEAFGSEVESFASGLPAPTAEDLQRRGGHGARGVQRRWLAHLLNKNNGEEPHPADAKARLKAYWNTGQGVLRFKRDRQTRARRVEVFLN